MKLRHYLFIFFLIWTIAPIAKLAANEICPIIPQPLQAEQQNGYFIFNGSVRVLGPQELAENMVQFRATLSRHTNYNLTKNRAEKAIHLILSKEIANEDAYELTITTNKIEVKAATVKGIANGLASLAQLIIHYYDKKGAKIPNWAIADEPRFAWRGLMLDESRHFFGERKVKQILDWMAYYKLNKFHWHLTDAPGWRLAIEKYPKLATVGGIGNNSNPEAPAKFYTQQQIRDIVAYAAARNIEIIPEIDMPGHATAANKAYPEYSGGGTEQHPEFTFNPGKEATYTYLTDILKEVKMLFKTDKIHLGADEVSFGAKAWETNAEVKQLMDKHQLKGILDVENYFVKRMADSIFKMDAKVLAWDEALSANLPKDKTLLFWWRHDKPQLLDQALSKGYQIVICPRLPLYLDFVQDENHKLGRKWKGEFNTLFDVYRFPEKSAFAENKLVVGLQGNVWTETIYNSKRLDFMLFPRIAALAEATWTQQENKNEAAFGKLLRRELKLYKKQGIYFYDPFDEERPKKIENPDQERKGEYIDPFVNETKLGKP